MVDVEEDVVTAPTLIAVPEPAAIKVAFPLLWLVEAAPVVMAPVTLIVPGAKPEPRPLPVKAAAFKLLPFVLIAPVTCTEPPVAEPPSIENGVLKFAPAIRVRFP